MKNIFHRKKIILGGILALVFLAFPDLTFARENVTDWYIKDFHSEIVVNRDSSLDITETILADCGQAAGKHGIFRMLPEKINVEGKGSIKTPITLESIKDEKGRDYEYSESKKIGDDMVTWKIGDKNKTVQGENTYVIKYRVENAIRFWNNDFDELYWNLTGNFWDLEIYHARIKLIFPEEVNQGNATVDVYSGALGEKGNALSNYRWSGKNVLDVESAGTLSVKQGITVSVTFPKNIFIPYKPGFWETYGFYFWLIIPILVLFYCFKTWKKYGDDPNFDKTVIAEYVAPKDMSPLEMGLLMTNGRFKNHFITAEIIHFATQKILTIKEIENKVLFFSSKDYELIRTNNQEAEAKLNGAEKNILDEIFKDGNTTKISSLKNSFYKILNTVKEKGNDILAEKGLIAKEGLNYSGIFLGAGIVIFFFGFVAIGVLGGEAGFALILSGIIFFIFSFIMPKRTLTGSEMNWKIKGFKLFMETVDKDRAKFYEQENIFEKFLPYAVLFEITDLWIKKIKEIYGEEYFANHAPAWYIGSHLGVFDADSFNSSLDELSSSIAANTSAPSGSGGSGGAGGGGGGGGGGGW